MKTSKPVPVGAGLVSAHFEAIVIGGGLAGACAAFHLARFGHRVLVLEKEAIAHHKVCGEFLSFEALPYLEELGIDLDGLGATSIEGLRLASPRFDCHLALQNRGRGLSRKLLDESCLRSAEGAGAQVLRGTTVTDFRRDDGNKGYQVSTSHGDFFAGALFLGSGKHEIKKLHVRRGKENSAIGLKLHLKLSRRSKSSIAQQVALFFYPGGYAGLCEIEGGIENLCFILDKKIYRRLGGGFEAALNYIQIKNRRLKDLLVDADRLMDRPLATANVPYGYLQRSGNGRGIAEGLYCLGDQFAVIPSLTGTGMAIALFTGKQAVQCFHRAASQGSAFGYEKVCRQALRSSMRLAYPLHQICRSASWADLGVLAVRTVPSLGNRLIQGTRLPFPEAIQDL